MLKQLKDEETGALHSGHDSNNTEIPVEADQSRPFRGLTSAEAADRFKRFGPNRLPTRRPAPNLEANNFPNGTFRVAGGLAILAGMPHLGLAIFVVILLNGIFAFAQEHRAERASEKLRELLPRRVLVIRDGIPSEISADDLVPGDLVCLRVGDRISADMKLVEAHALAIDASALTGESVPVALTAGENAFAGTLVREGEANGVVTATGKATRLGSIAQIAQSSHRPRIPLAIELDRVVRVIAIVATSVGCIFLLVAALAGIHLTDSLLFAIGVFVALVPEGLLPTVTLSLAMGAQRMAVRHALVRRLESVETLGSATFICTDKTGTLTLNEMAVVAAWTPSGSAAFEGLAINRLPDFYRESARACLRDEPGPKYFEDRGQRQRIRSWSKMETVSE